nr:ribonuclease HI family protein [uncultured Flavobacterium sp.]
MDKKSKKNKDPENPNFFDLTNSIEIWFDGSCEPYNPGGRMGYGAVIKKNGQTLKELYSGEPSNDKNSNNVAEYSALKMSLEYLIENGLNNERVFVRGDSKLVIMQMTGRWGIKEGRYVDVAKETFGLLKQFPKIYLKWIPREENQEADGLSNRYWIENNDFDDLIDFYEPPACLV